MLKRLTCFVSGEHHYRMREDGGRVFLECQQCGQRSAGLESTSRPVLNTTPTTSTGLESGGRSDVGVKPAVRSSARSSASPRPNPPITPQKADADQFLREMLANGPMRQVDVTRAATVQGIAARTLRRARVRLGVVATKHGFGTGSFWVWRLRPSSEREGSHGRKNRPLRRRRPQDAGQLDHTPDA